MAEPQKHGLEIMEALCEAIPEEADRSPSFDVAFVMGMTYGMNLARVAPQWAMAVLQAVERDANCDAGATVENDEFLRKIVEALPLDASG